MRATVRWKYMQVAVAGETLSRFAEVKWEEVETGCIVWRCRAAVKMFSRAPPPATLHRTLLQSGRHGDLPARN